MLQKGPIIMLGLCKVEVGRMQREIGSQRCECGRGRENRIVMLMMRDVEKKDVWFGGFEGFQTAAWIIVNKICQSASHLRAVCSWRQKGVVFADPFVNLVPRPLHA